MPKVTKSKKRTNLLEPNSSSTKAHDPLGQQIMRDEEAGRYAKSKSNMTSSSSAAQPQRRRSDRTEGDVDDDDDEYDRDNYRGGAQSYLLDHKSSQRILDMSREQRLEEERLEEIRHRRKPQPTQSRRSGVAADRGYASCRGRERDDASYDSDDNDSVVGEDNTEHDTWVRHDDQGYVSVVMDPNDGDADGGGATAAAMSKEDLDLINSMMNPSSERRTLADMILEKIDERQKELRQQQQQQSKGNSPDEPPELPPKVVHVYTEIGKMLTRYTAGKLPKAFKVIPSLSNWQDILWLTRPDQWTPQAMYAATRIFASNLNPKMAQQFYHLVLLDAVRNDIHFNKKLNYHYYMSLKKSIYKPAAFFKGILLPLVEPDADTTLREAIIVASVLQRVSIPVHHAAVAIHKLAQTTSSKSESNSSVLYSGPVSIFLKVLLNKKYSLPALVIDGVVSYFGSFLRNTRVPGGHDNVLPVLWHQALLVFVQRYKDEIRTSDNAMRRLKLVMKKHFHPKLTPEIRRELVGGQQAWKEQEEEATMKMIVD